MERWVCAPQREEGGMRRVPKVSDSKRDGREVMSLATLSSCERTVDDTPGWKVEGAKICFMVSVSRP